MGLAVGLLKTIKCYAEIRRYAYYGSFHCSLHNKQITS